jgi:hypothetical protein
VKFFVVNWCSGLNERENMSGDMHPTLAAADGRAAALAPDYPYVEVVEVDPRAGTSKRVRAYEFGVLVEGERLQ